MYEVSNKRKSIKRRKNKSLFYKFHNFVTFILCFCLIISIVTTNLLNNIVKESQDSGNSEIIAGDTSSSLLTDIKPAKVYPDIKRHAIDELKSSGSKEIYVPSVPSGVNGDEASTISEALTKIPEGGIIWLTQDITIDMVSITNGQVYAISSYGNQQYNITKDGTSENMFTISDKSELVIENVNIDAENNQNGRTISLTESPVLTLGQGATLQNNTYYGAIYADNSSVCIDGGTISNNTATGEVGKKTYEPSGVWVNQTTKNIFDQDKAGKQALGGAVLMVNGSALEMTSGEIKANKAVSGGAIYSWASGNIKFKGGKISSNIAETDEEGMSSTGGAVTIDGGYLVDVITEIIIDGATFYQNTAKQGGVFYFGIDTGTIDFIMNSGTIDSNTSTGDGSVLYSLAADGVINISGDQSLITNNNATSSGAFYIGMYPGNPQSDRAKMYIHDGVLFTKNYANKGSCFYVTRDGGSKGFIFDGISFTNNESKNDAGIMQYGAPDSNILIRNTNFQDNKAGNRGGIFYFAADSKGTQLTVDSSTFTNNSATSDGGVLRGFPPETKLIFKNTTFKNNKSGGSGGVFYFPADGKNSEIEIDNTKFIGNTAEVVGGAFRAGLQNAVLTIKGDTLFTENTAKVNAGAFAVYRKEKGIGGTVNLLEAKIVNNHCYSDFSNYTAKDLVPTQHYNTGGIYVGEDVTLQTFDAEITNNQIESGYENNTIGTGIGICPHGTVILNPEHGAKIHDNGDGEGMDILAVPWDESIDHEVPSQLYIPEKTPDGKDYNWTDLSGEDARTGLYSWDEALKEKEDEIQGISRIAFTANTNEYKGEKTLDPVGFKANIDEPAKIRTMAANINQIAQPTNEPTTPKVYIAGNTAGAALYGGGGLMINGTLIAGDLEISVEKKTEGLPEEEKKTKEFEFTLEISTEENAFSGIEDGKEVDFTRTGSNITGEETGKAKFTLTTNDRTSKLSYTFKLKSDEKITFSNFGNIWYTSYDYKFNLVENDSGGAAESKIEYVVKTKNDEILSGNLNSSNYPDSSKQVQKIEFTSTNTFKNSLIITKNVEIIGDNELFTNKEYTFLVTGPENYSQTVKLSKENGWKQMLTELTAGEYTVVEQDANVDGYYLETVMNPADGKITVTDDKAVIISVTNKYKKSESASDQDEAFFGDLIVSKTVTGSSGNPNIEFHFNIELDNKNINGTFGDITFENGLASFTLKHGESKKAIGLPSDVNYTITETEANQNGYTTTATNDKGTIPKNDTITAEFINNNNKDTSSPETKPDNHISFWLILLLISFVIRFIAGIIGKKHQYIHKV